MAGSRRNAPSGKATENPAAPAGPSVVTSTAVPGPQPPAGDVTPQNELTRNFLEQLRLQNDYEEALSNQARIRDAEEERKLQAEDRKRQIEHEARKRQLELELLEKQIEQTSRPATTQAAPEEEGS